ncbi:terpenoid synthase [Paxillus ammoniavirescens]|nr:terpenoid synthase [Paxillus ammoniavirescens]
MCSSSPFSMLAHLRQGTTYGAIVGAHLDSPPLQTWLSLCTASFLFIDDIPRHLQGEFKNMRLFNQRFVNGEKQGNVALGAVAGHFRQIPSVFGRPISANLVTTSVLNGITAGVIEWDNRDMKVVASAERYSSYLRSMSGIGVAYTIMAFPPDIPLEEYIQALPEIDFFTSIANGLLYPNKNNSCVCSDLLSFYKEELIGERTNYIAILAARQGISRMEAFEQVGDHCANLFEKIVIILENSNKSALRFSRVREAFVQYVEGTVAFHLSCDRYRLTEVGL